MRNNDQNQRGGKNNSLLQNSIRTFSTYFKAVSSGASTVVKSAASAASNAIAERESDAPNDQVVELLRNFDCLYLLCTCFACNLYLVLLKHLE